MGPVQAFFFLGLSGLMALGTAPLRANAPQPESPPTQLVVCLAETNEATSGTLQLFHREGTGEWQADAEPWPVLFGRRGLAWGRGLNPPQPGLQKRAGDGRNPAGLFALGPAFGYAAALPTGALGWPYHQVTARDAWIDLPGLPNYNHLYTLPLGAPLPAWWGKEHMHLGDAAYRWMVLIEDNYNGPVDPQGGNAIFFHIQRPKPHYRTAGCTAMPADRMVQLVQWLKPDSHAELAEMSRADYARWCVAWHLPPILPSTAALSLEKP